jgi:hypothetical protein
MTAFTSLTPIHRLNQDDISLAPVHMNRLHSLPTITDTGGSHSACRVEDEKRLLLSPK